MSENWFEITNAVDVYEESLKTLISCEKPLQQGCFYLRKAVFNVNKQHIENWGKGRKKSKSDKILNTEHNSNCSNV